MRIETRLPEPERIGVVITLSWEEARVLRTIVGCIGGQGRGRKVTTALFEGLNDIGVRSADSLIFHGDFRSG